MAGKPNNPRLPTQPPTQNRGLPPGDLPLRRGAAGGKTRRRQNPPEANEPDRPHRTTASGAYRTTCDNAVDADITNTFDTSGSDDSFRLCRLRFPSRTTCVTS